MYTNLLSINEDGDGKVNNFGYAIKFILLVVFC